MRSSSLVSPAGVRTGTLGKGDGLSPGTTSHSLLEPATCQSRRGEVGEGGKVRWGKVMAGLGNRTKKLDFILKATRAVHLGSPAYLQ